MIRVRPLTARRLGNFKRLLGVRSMNDAILWLLANAGVPIRSVSAREFPSEALYGVAVGCRVFDDGGKCLFTGGICSKDTCPMERLRK